MGAGIGCKRGRTKSSGLDGRETKRFCCCANGESDGRHFLSIGCARRSSEPVGEDKLLKRKILIVGHRLVCAQCSAVESSVPKNATPSGRRSPRLQKDSERYENHERMDAVQVLATYYCS